MTEIKFRGKQVDSGEWHCGFYVKGRHGSHYILSEYSGLATIAHSVEGGTVGRWTGLKDKSGAEIFEADIVRLDGEIFTVAYNDGAFGLHKDGNPRGNLYHWYEFRKPTHEPYVPEVIGNIHDGRELPASGMEPAKTCAKCGEAKSAAMDFIKGHEACIECEYLEISQKKKRGRPPAGTEAWKALLKKAMSKWRAEAAAQEAEKPEQSISPPPAELPSLASEEAGASLSEQLVKEMQAAEEARASGAYNQPRPGSSPPLLKTPKFGQSPRRA